MPRISLYSRLLKYQETEERSNFENFLTEILCDFLNRFTLEENHDFIQRVLFSFQSFLFATERLGLSRADARKCREMTSSFTLGIAYSGNWRLALLSDKTDEDYHRETAFVLGFLAKFIPLAQDVYPDAMQKIHARILLTEQPR